MIDKLYHYILVRKDLPIGVQMVNVAHAAGESILEAPIPSNTIAVVLHVENEAELINHYNILVEKKIECILIREPDAPYNLAAMSIGVKPSNRRNALRRLFYHLKLVA